MTTRYSEFVIDGTKGWDLGFVSGFLHGRGLGGRIINAENEGFDCEPLREQLRKLFGSGLDTVHFLVPEDLVKIVEEAVSASGKASYPLVVRHKRTIAGADFNFSVHTYARKEGQLIRKTLENPPEGVRVTMGKPFEETVDPASVGVELYAPSHEYELEGRGTVEGALDGVIELYRFCRDEELVHQEKARLIVSE